MTHARLAGVAVVLLTLAMPTPTRAASPVPATEASAAAVSERRTRAADELEPLRRRLETETEPVARDLLRREADVLQRVVLLLTQQGAAIERRTELTGEIESIRAEIKRQTFEGPAEKPPYALPQLDQLHDRLASLESEKRRAAGRLAAAEEAAEEARGAAADKERERRQLSDRYASAAADDERRQIATDLRLSQLEHDAATEVAALRTIAARNQQLDAELLQAQIDKTSGAIQWMADRVQFSADALAAIQDGLVKREEDLLKAVQDAEGESRKVEPGWLKAKSRLEGTADPDPALAAEVEARRRAYLTARDEVVLTGRKIERLRSVRQLWERRYRIANATASRPEVNAWRTDATREVERQRRDLMLQTAELASLRRDMTTLIALLDAETGNSVRRWLRQRQERIEQSLRAHEADLYDLETALRLNERLLAETESIVATTPGAARIAQLGRDIVSIWSYELATVEGGSITVGKVIAGLLLLILSFYLSQRLSGLLAARILPRLGLDEGVVGALQPVAFYAFLIAFALLALRLLNVPLTAFTLLGGAAAIGIGFGSQNVINNFISGLILLAERPIRVGDLIQLGDLYGNVVRVGARATVVRTGEHVDIVVPNSTLLEENVINWTLSATNTRVNVAVGVAYGSATREVARLLLHAVNEHGRVLRSPEPMVLFTDFGDNALHFEVHFWIKMRSIMDRRTIQSDIRHRTDGLFRDAGIVIAFPQRDVHLDAVGPVTVRIEPPAEASVSPASTEVNRRESL